MKKLTLLFVFITSTIVSQTNTEVYLFDIEKTETGYKLTNKKNVSNNKEYDSQPYFYDNNTLLFASSRNEQTDILKYTIKTGKKVFINSTPKGGEYSPQRIPGSDDISAVRLDNSGLQRFYRYDINTGDSKEIIRSLKLAYPLWYSDKLVISAVIGKNSLDLVTSDLKHKTNFTLQNNIGRSLHKIPNSSKVSYISKKNPQWEIRSLDVSTLRTAKIAELDGKYEDIYWMSEDVVLQAKKNKILQLNTKTDTVWSELFTVDDAQIQNISRISISPDGTKMAIVGEESPRFVVDKQLEAYNNRDIEAYVNVFSEDVKVYDYPHKLRYQGRKEMKRRYAAFFRNTKDLNCKIVKRIENGNLVIDEESITINGRIVHGVAVYEIKDGRIITVTFM
tara:strand:+ start:3316 stop:4491 length:1176 start_codon:yes stop_codon:yes gene_type:complete